jgi:predicted GIY-YIG superfamily endonuclease
VFYCYILLCADGSFCIVSTADLNQRYAKHQDGSASAYTAARRPVTLAYAEPFSTPHQARTRERQIKGWTRDKKQALVSGDRDRLKTLSRRGMRDRSFR